MPSKSNIHCESSSKTPLGKGLKAINYKGKFLEGCDGLMYNSIKWGNGYRWKKVSDDYNIKRISKKEVKSHITKSSRIEKIPKKNQLIVKQVGASEFRNTRRYMEDYHYLTENFIDKTPSAFFTVCDGYGGAQVAKYVTTNIHKMLLKKLPLRVFNNEDAVFKALDSTFCELDKEVLKKKEFEGEGSTVVSALILEDPKTSKRHLYTANVGDSRAVLSRNGTPLRMTIDHTGRDKDEIERIEAQGGFVVRGRVRGLIAVSRSLGHSDYKENLICNPFSKHVILTPSDDYLIIATDGLWDVVSDEEAVDLARHNSKQSADRIAMILQELAIKRSSEDNITVVVIKL